MPFLRRSRPNRVGRKRSPALFGRLCGTRTGMGHAPPPGFIPPAVPMFDISGLVPYVEEEEPVATEKCSEGPPAPEKPPCDHHKVYAARNSAPYVWICSACLFEGEDEQYPVIDSRLYQQLTGERDSGAEPAEEPGKIRACYYCGKHVIGHFSETQPVRCGKCI